MRNERLLDVIRFGGQRQPGRDTDNPIAVARDDDDAVRDTQIRTQIVAFVVETAGVEVGKFAKYLDTQPGEVPDVGSGIAPGETPYFNAHVSTAMQVRLNSTWKS